MTTLAARAPYAPPRATAAVNPVVRWAFYFFIFSIPFEMPNRSIPVEIPTLTGALFLLTTPLEYRACFGRVPAALVWFAGWLWVAIVSGLLHSGTHALMVLHLLMDLFELLLVCWTGSNLMRDRRVLRGALITLVAACALRAAFQVAGVGLTAHRVWTGGERETVFGQNANISALILACGLVAAFGLRHPGAVRLLRPHVLFWPLAALFATAVVHTGSRGGFLALTAGLVVQLFRGRTVLQRLRSGFAVLVVMVSLIWAASHVEMMRNRLQAAAQGSFAGRERIYPALLGMVIERPVLGWGPITNQYELAQRIEERVLPRRDAHNLVLEVLTTTGFIGLIPFLTGLSLCVLAAWRGRHGTYGILPVALLVTMGVGTMSGTWIASKILWLTFACALASGPARSRDGAV